MYALFSTRVFVFGRVDVVVVFSCAVAVACIKEQYVCATRFMLFHQCGRHLTIAWVRLFRRNILSYTIKKGHVYHLAYPYSAGKCVKLIVNTHQFLCIEIIKDELCDDFRFSWLSNNFLSLSINYDAFLVSKIASHSMSKFRLKWFDLFSSNRFTSPLLYKCTYNQCLCRKIDYTEPCFFALIFLRVVRFFFFHWTTIFHSITSPYIVFGHIM